MTTLAEKFAQFTDCHRYNLRRFGARAPMTQGQVDMLDEALVAIRERDSALRKLREVHDDSHEFGLVEMVEGILAAHLGMIHGVSRGAEAELERDLLREKLTAAVELIEALDAVEDGRKCCHDDDITDEQYRVAFAETHSALHRAESARSAYNKLVKGKPGA